MSEEIIWDELRQNDIKIDRDTFGFYINKCVVEHQELYDTIKNIICGPYLLDNLYGIYQEMGVMHFGRIIAYLALVLSVSCDTETVRMLLDLL